MEAAQKVVAIAEAYARVHPDESRAYEALSSAYRNSSIVDDPRMSRDQAVARGIELSRKALTVQEKLVAMHPGEVAWEWTVAETLFNLGDGLVDQGAYDEAIEHLSRASPVLTARASDKSDLRARLISLMVESTLAGAQFKVGRIVEAEKSLLGTERGLVELATRYDNLQVTFYLAKTRMHLGVLYSQRASRASLAPSAQLAQWRTARDWLERGKLDLEKVRAVIHMEGTEDETYQTGIADLAKADAAIARLTSR
jgi:hypothetical protein